MLQDRDQDRRISVSSDRETPRPRSRGLQDCNKPAISSGCFRDSNDRFCVSLIDPGRPAWYVRHYGYYLHLEPEYAPRNPHIFDEDASFLLIPDAFSPEFFALESVNFPHHYIQVAQRRFRGFTFLNSK